jgi:hypothetical protein
MKQFDIAKYLRENYEGPFKTFQPYVDLNPLKEDEDLGQQEAIPEPYEGDGHPIDGLGGKLNRHMDVSMNEENMEEEMHFNDEIAMLSQEYIKWLEQNNLPKMSADELLADLSIEKTDEQKAWLQTFIDRWEDAMDADNIDEEVSVSSSGVEMEEVDSAEEGDLDRMYGLFELQLQKLITGIIDAGYEPEDAAQFLRDYANHLDKGGM